MLDLECHVALAEHLNYPQTDPQSEPALRFNPKTREALCRTREILLYKTKQLKLDEKTFANSNPGGTKKNLIRGGFAPRSDPLPFYIPFSGRKYIPFVCLPLDQIIVPVSHIN